MAYDIYDPPSGRTRRWVRRKDNQARMPGWVRFLILVLCAAMLVMSILGIIAMSSYTSQVQKSRRTDAKNALLDIAGREEQLYSTINAYSALPTDVGYTGTAFPITVGGGYYSVTIAVTAATAAVPATFTITATPLGTQVKDTDCASLTTNQLGVQAATNTAGANTTNICW